MLTMLIQQLLESLLFLQLYLLVATKAIQITFCWKLLAITFEPTSIDQIAH